MVIIMKESNNQLETLQIYQKIKFRMKRNQFIYYLSKVPIIKNMVPENAFTKDSATVLGYVIYAFIKLCVVLFYNILHGFGVVILTELLKSQYRFSAINLLIILLYFSYGLLTVNSWSSYLRGDATEQDFMLRYFKLESNRLAKIVHIETILKGFLNSLFLFIVTDNILISILALLAWYSGLTLADSAIVASIKKYNRFALRGGDKATLKGTIRIFLSSLLIYPFGILAYVQIPIYISTQVLALLVMGGFLISIIIKRIVLQSFDWYPSFKEKIMYNDQLLDKVEKGEWHNKSSEVKDLSQNFDRHIHGEGFTKLNNIFFRRFSNVWRKRFWLHLFVISVGVIGLYFIGKEGGNEFLDSNGNLSSMLGIILLGAYYLNFGNRITQALFNHCDSIMLGYRNYNNGKNVLLNFIQRVKHVVRVHIPQTLIISLGGVLLTLILHPDTKQSLLLLIFMAFMSAGIALCIHTLVLYYLFQPYTLEMEMKSLGYTVADIVTYIFVYGLSGFKGDPKILLIIITSSAFIYFLVASVLVYFLAPKTFKIRR